MPDITSTANPLVKLIRSLELKKNRKETSLFAASGVKVLERARAEGWTPEHLILREDERPKPLNEWAKYTTVSNAVMAALSGQDNPPEALAVFRQKAAPAIKPDGLWIVLEDIRDPGNLGTIIRTADAAGAKGVALAGDCCDPWGPDAVRATMGSIFGVPVAFLAKDAFLKTAAAWPGDVTGTAMDAAADFKRAYRPPALLVMGSEGTGLSPVLRAACSITVRIPMAAGPESLNVATATALMAYEIQRGAL